jgi:sugar phosphate isomerase/epimerase
MAASAPLLANTVPRNQGTNLGVQLWVLRDLLAKDFDGTLAQVAAMGITNVEFAGFFGRTASQVRTSLSRAGIRATGAHCIAAKDSDEQIKRTIDFCGEAGISYLIAAVPSRKRSSPDNNVFRHIELADWQWSAERFNAIGARIRSAGMHCGYHNHNIDFLKYGDVVAFDEMLRITDPALVAIEFDIGNAAAAGVDPYSYFAKYPHRFKMAHVKEWAAPFAPTLTIDFPKYAPFGKGTTDWSKLLATLRAQGIREVFIEQDGTPTGQELEAVRQAYQYLKTVS